MLAVPPLRDPIVPADRGAADAAIAAWVGRHQRGVWRFLRQLGCEPASADDLAQEALLAALHKGIPTLPDRDGARWLRAAARNLRRMQLRASARRREREHGRDDLAEIAFATHADGDGGDAWVAALRRCVEALGDADRALLAARYDDGASRAHLARAAGVAEEGVKTRLRRLRARLRACVLRRLDTAEER